MASFAGPRPAPPGSFVGCLGRGMPSVQTARNLDGCDCQVIEVVMLWACMSVEEAMPLASAAFCRNIFRLLAGRSFGIGVLCRLYL